MIKSDKITHLYDYKLWTYKELEKGHSRQRQQQRERRRGGEEPVITEELTTSTQWRTRDRTWVEAGNTAKDQIRQCLVSHRKEFQFSSQSRILSRGNDTWIYNVKGLLWTAGWTKNERPAHLGTTRRARRWLRETGAMEKSNSLVFQQLRASLGWNLGN